MWDAGTYYGSEWSEYQYGEGYNPAPPGTETGYAGDLLPPGVMAPVDTATTAGIDQTAYANAGWQQWVDPSADPAQQYAATTSEYTATAIDPTASADTTQSYNYDDPSAYLAATGMDVATYAAYAAAFAAIKNIPKEINNPFEKAKEATNSPEPTAEVKKKEAQTLSASLRKRHPVARGRINSGIKDKAPSRKIDSPSVTNTPSDNHNSQSPAVATSEAANGVTSMDWDGNDTKGGNSEIPEVKGRVQEGKENDTKTKDAVNGNASESPSGAAKSPAEKDTAPKVTNGVKPADAAPSRETAAKKASPEPYSTDDYDDVADLLTESQTAKTEEDPTAKALAAIKALEEKNKHVLRRGPPPRRDRRDNGRGRYSRSRSRSRPRVRSRSARRRRSRSRSRRRGGSRSPARRRSYERRDERDRDGRRRHDERADERRGRDDRAGREERNGDVRGHVERIVRVDGDRTPDFIHKRPPSVAPEAPVSIPDTAPRPADDGDGVKADVQKSDHKSSKRKHRHEKSDKHSSSSHRHHRDKESDRRDERESKRRRSRSRRRDEVKDVHRDGAGGSRDREHRERRDYGGYGYQEYRNM
ncbi:hypothetical protein HK097_001324 [Rhizophlyctis rosea]|uniref:Uncharacterized protein n=1 Tax=Rhizophlyctis rosea TaxID=64517 RepID=A0AAD5SHN4_9FUNG|nr:hypothetical protein HK097_001324 [Rhizophlyctis rosea]